jgi:Icc-related predicted phosphoesterase
MLKTPMLKTPMMKTPMLKTPMMKYLKHEGIKIGFISDIHLEFRNYHHWLQHFNYNTSKCDIIVLAGDIGNPFHQSNYYQRFLEKCSTQAKHTLLVAGNHEFYQKHKYSMIQTKNKLKLLCSLINERNERDNFVDFTSNNGNVHFLDNSVFTYMNPNNNTPIQFIGSTLWSNVSKEHENTIYNSINDYSQIMEFTPSLSRQLYIRSSEFINKQLQQCQTIQTKQEQETNISTTNTTSSIVITHYPPSTTNVSDPKYNGSKLNSAFSTDFTFTTKNRPLAWIFGHTHYNVERFDDVLGTTLLSHQAGYPNE